MKVLFNESFPPIIRIYYYAVFLGGMELNEVTELENELSELKARVDLLEQEHSSKSVLSAGQIGPIGTFLLGAIVLIGILWL